MLRAYQNCIVGLFVVVSTFSSGASASEPLPHLRAQHPRVIILSDDISRTKKIIETDVFARKLFDVLHRRADEMLVAASPTYSLNSGDSLKSSRLALKHLTTFAGFFRLTGDRKYFARAREEMLAISQYPDWGPANFLCVAEMTAALAIGYDWLYEDLSVADRRSIRSGIIKNGLLPGLEQYKGNAWWVNGGTNWNFVCNGGLVLGALAIAEDEPVLSERIVEYSLNSLPNALKTFAPDGGWPEGPGYWTYGTRYLTYCIAAFQSAFDDDFALLQFPGFSETGFFRIYSEGPTGLSFNFADSETEVPRGAQMFWLSRQFKKPVFAGAELHIAEIFPEMFHLLFYSADHAAPIASNLPLNKLFSGINVAFFRSAWNDPNAFFVGFKGGENRWSHAHADLGSFVLDAAGYRWAENLGPDDYDLPGYFKDQRFNYYRLQTRAHNTLTVGADCQPKDGHAEIVSLSTTGDSPSATINLTNAYAGQFTDCYRTISLPHGQRLLVQDVFTPKNEHASVVWHLHTRAVVSIENKGHNVVLTQGKGEHQVKMNLQIEDLPEAVFSTEKIIVPANEAQQKDVTDLIIRLDDVKTKRPTKLLVSFSLAKSN